MQADPAEIFLSRPLLICFQADLAGKYFVGLHSKFFKRDHDHD